VGYTLGYNDLTICLSQAVNLIISHKFRRKYFPFFKPFRLRLHSNFVKSANMTYSFFSKKQYGDKKNAEFDFDFESVEELAKKLIQKRYYRKVTEI
jgi:hypothetical protein